MQARRGDWFEGWRLFALLALILTGLCVWIAGMRGFEVEGVRMVVRFTARSSLLSAWPSRPRRWRWSGPAAGRAGCAATVVSSA